MEFGGRETEGKHTVEDPGVLFTTAKAKTGDTL